MWSRYVFATECYSYTYIIIYTCCTIIIVNGIMYYTYALYLANQPRSVGTEDSAIVLKLEDAGVEFTDADLVYR